MALGKTCNRSLDREKKFGEDRAGKIRDALFLMHYQDSLEDIMFLASVMILKQEDGAYDFRIDDCCRIRFRLLAATTKPHTEAIIKVVSIQVDE